MTVFLPRGLRIDLDHVPDDFDDLIVNAFLEYTEGTAMAYRYIDQLGFIDACVRLLKGNVSPETAVRQLLHDTIDYQLDEFGVFPSPSDFDESFHVYCYNAGQRFSQLKSEYVQKGSTEDEKIMKLLCRIIKIVMNINLAMKESVNHG